MIVILICFIFLFLFLKIKDKFNFFDNFTLNLSLFTIILLIFSLITKNDILRDLAHIFITIITLFLSINLKNKKLIILNITSILTTLCFWIFSGKCPVGHYNNFYYIHKLLMYINKLNLAYYILLTPLTILIYKLIK